MDDKGHSREIFSENEKHVKARNKQQILPVERIWMNFEALC